MVRLKSSSCHKIDLIMEQVKIFCAAPLKMWLSIVNRNINVYNSLCYMTSQTWVSFNRFLGNLLWTINFFGGWIRNIRKLMRMLDLSGHLALHIRINKTDLTRDSLVITSRRLWANWNNRMCLINPGGRIGCVAITHLYMSGWRDFRTVKR